MLLKLVKGVGLAAVGALCDMFNAEVVMQGELRLIHGFGAIRCVFRVHKTYQLSQTYSGFWEPSVTKVSFWFKPRVKPD